MLTAKEVEEKFPGYLESIKKDLLSRMPFPYECDLIEIMIPGKFTPSFGRELTSHHYKPIENECVLRLADLLNFFEKKDMESKGEKNALQTKG